MEGLNLPNLIPDGANHGIVALFTPNTSLKLFATFTSIQLTKLFHYYCQLARCVVRLKTRLSSPHPNQHLQPCDRQP